MPQILYSFTEMDTASKALADAGDDLRSQVEGIWKSLTATTEALPYHIVQAASPNFDDFLSLMIPTIARMLALRDSIATQLRLAAQAAQQAEGDNGVPRHPGHVIPE